MQIKRGKVVNHTTKSNKSAIRIKPFTSIWPQYHSLPLVFSKSVILLPTREEAAQILNHECVFSRSTPYEGRKYGFNRRKSCQDSLIPPFQRFTCILRMALRVLLALLLPYLMAIATIYIWC